MQLKSIDQSIVEYADANIALPTSGTYECSSQDEVNDDLFLDLKSHFSA